MIGNLKAGSRTLKCSIIFDRVKRDKKWTIKAEIWKNECQELGRNIKINTSRLDQVTVATAVVDRFLNSSSSLFRIYRIQQLQKQRQNLRQNLIHAI